MARYLSLLAATLFLAGSLFAGPQAPKKKEAGIHCTLTGKDVKTCCCEPRGDKLYCTLAKKPIDKCCCKPPQTPKARK